MTGDLVIRGLRNEDRPRWLPLWLAYLDYYRSDLPADVTRAVFDRLVGPDPSMEGLVAIRDGAEGRDSMVGFAHCVIHPNTWSHRTDTYLEDLFVTPAGRGAGVGRALVEAIAVRAEARGDRRVHWLTEADNVRARGLYDQVADLSGYVRYVRDVPSAAVVVTPPGRAIGVFCASASGLDRTWHEAAEQVGTTIGEAGHRLVYGGTNSGTMATLARAASEAGAHVTGVTLHRFVEPSGDRRGLAKEERFDHGTCDELVVTTDLFDRKRQMLLRADGFIALPGGPGTLDEIGDVLAGRRLGLHDRPLVLCDHAGFWTPLLATFELMAHTGFTVSGRSDYQVAATAADAVPTIEASWTAAAEAAVEAALDAEPAVPAIGSNSLLP